MSTENNQFRLRLYPNTSYNFVVHWGDGTRDIVSGTTPVYQGLLGNGPWTLSQQATVSATWPGITHTYASSGKYTVSISELTNGGFTGLQYAGVNDSGWDAFDEFNNDYKKVTKISQWGTPKWNPSKAMVNSFEGCVNLKDVVTDGETSTLSALSGFNQAWNNCTSLSSFEKIDTRNVIIFDNVWTNCNKLKIFPNIDTSKGTNFNQTWQECVSLSSFPFIDTSNAKIFSHTWQNCNSLRSFPLIDTKNVSNFQYTWNLCLSLTSFPLINTSNGTNFYGTWYYCSNIKEFPSIDTLSATTFSYTWTGCSSLTSFPNLISKNVNDFNSTWSNCTSLRTFPLIDTGNGTNFNNTWSNCLSLTSFPLINTSKGTTFNYTWSNCSKLSSFPLLDFSKATTLRSAWEGCTSLSALPLIDTSNCLIFQRAWSGCSNLKYFPPIDTSKATSMYDAFHTNNVDFVEFPVLDLRSIQGWSGGYSMLNVAKVPTSTWSAILTTISAFNINTGVTLNGGRSKHNAIAQQAIDYLTTQRSWTIQDGGLE